MLVDAAAEALDDPVGGGVEAPEQRVHILGVERARHPRVVDEIREEDGDRPPLAVAGSRSPVAAAALRGRSRRVGASERAAAAAEFLAGLVRETARRTGDGQPRAALRAEAPARPLPVPQRGH